MSDKSGQLARYVPAAEKVAEVELQERLADKHLSFEHRRRLVAEYFRRAGEVMRLLEQGALPTGAPPNVHGNGLADDRPSPPVKIDLPPRQRQVLARLLVGDSESRWPPRCGSRNTRSTTTSRSCTAPSTPPAGASCSRASFARQRRARETMDDNASIRHSGFLTSFTSRRSTPARISACTSHSAACACLRDRSPAPAPTPPSPASASQRCRRRR